MSMNVIVPKTDEHFATMIPFFLYYFTIPHPLFIGFWSHIHVSASKVKSSWFFVPTGTVNSKSNKTSLCRNESTLEKTIKGKNKVFLTKFAYITLPYVMLLHLMLKPDTKHKKIISLILFTLLFSGGWPVVTISDNECTTNLFFSLLCHKILLESKVKTCVCIVIHFCGWIYTFTQDRWCFLIWFCHPPTRISGINKIFMWKVCSLPKLWQFLSVFLQKRKLNVILIEAWNYFQFI